MYHLGEQLEDPQTALKDGQSLCIMPERTQISTESLEKLISLGFPKARAYKALLRYSDLDDAIDWLLKNWEAMEIDY